MSLIPIDPASLTASAVFTKGQNQIVVTVSATAPAATTSAQLTRSFDNRPPTLDYKLLGTTKSNVQGVQFLTVSKTEPWTDLTAAGVPTVAKVGIIITTGTTSIEGKNVSVPLTIVDPAAATQPVVTPAPNPTPATNGTASIPATNPTSQPTIPKPQPIADIPPPGLALSTRLKEIPITLPSNQFVRITAPLSSTTTVEGAADNADFLLTWRAGVLNAQTAYWDLMWTNGAQSGKVGFNVTTTGAPGGKSIQPYALTAAKAVGG